MKELNQYIFEKFKITKDIDPDNRKYIATFGLDNGVKFVEEDSLDKIIKYVNRNLGKTISKRDLLVFDCPANLFSQVLLDICRNYYREEYGFSKLLDLVKKEKISYIGTDYIIKKKEK